MKNNNSQVAHDTNETTLIRKDLITVVVLNLILFAVLIGLYLWNRSSGQIDQWFSQLIKF